MANKKIGKRTINGNELREAIKDSGYSIRSLANEIGYSDRQIRTYLKEGEMPDHVYEKIFQKVYVKHYEPLIMDADDLFPGYKFDYKPKPEHDDFFDWLACAVVLDSDWEENPGFYREVICRKLVRLGKLKIDNDCYELIDPEKEN